MTHAKRGQFCISIDLELAWGWWDCPDAAWFELIRAKERLIVRRLLGLFDRYDIRATWAIVGALLAPPRTPDMQRDDMLWYAPDLIEAIVQATPRQEIGSHSFGHVYFDRLHAAAAREDLEKAKEIHEAHGLGWGSFIFPRNLPGHLPLLAQHGLTIFRGPDTGLLLDLAAPAGSKARRLANLVDKSLPFAPRPQRVTKVHEGLYDCPGSMLWMSRHGIRRIIRPEVLRMKAIAGLNAALKQQKVFHLWFHPSNFFFDTEVAFGAFETVLQRVTGLRRDAGLEIATLGELATQAMERP